MVEATNMNEASNPFHMKTANDDICPHMSLLGVCPEPAMCFLKHTTETPAEFSTAAKEFNPFAAQPAVASREFNPEAQPLSEQEALQDILCKMGFDAQVDQDMGTIFMKSIEDCSCCKGFVNNCKGKACDNLGMCFCIAARMHEDQ